MMSSLYKIGRCVIEHLHSFGLLKLVYDIHNREDLMSYTKQLLN